MAFAVCKPIRLKIRTYVLFSVAALLLLLVGVAVMAISRVNEIGNLAGDLNGRVIVKTRIANDIADLGQQIRFVDAFYLQSSDVQQDELATRMITDRVAAIGARTAAYNPYVDSDLERSLLRNLQRSRVAYLGLQSEILAMPQAERRAHAAENEDRLATAFDRANRQARGLAHLAEAEARTTREQAVAIAEDARSNVAIAAVLALVIGILILLQLRASIFQPLTQITQALVALAGGRLDVPLFEGGRGVEMDAMSQALDVFRQNAVALAKAHEEVKAAHSRADMLARHDALTGLPNRRVLATAIEEAIARGRGLAATCAVLVLDLDGFKPVNDVCGHGAGDKVLCEVAQRLRAALGPWSTAARLGGDEFAVVVEFAIGSDEPRRLADRIGASIAQPMLIEGRTVTISTSVGIAICPADGMDAEALLHAADLAMFKAKRDRRAGARRCEPRGAAQAA